MQSFGKNFIIRSVFVAVFFSVAEFSLAAADTNSTYAHWIKPWSAHPATSPALAGAGLKLLVSNVRGEAEVTAVSAMTPMQRLDLAYHIRVSATEVATNGAVRSYVVSNTDARTSDARWLSPGQLQLLDQLIAQLPDDASQLPPAGNRVVLQTFSNGQWCVRVYDGNHLPTEVQSVLSFLAQPYGKLF